ncbi:GAF domain-containing protein [Phormidium sp. LEGE 05292]|uniref:GAF domain-containing protein n=1 Tax=[Phormidium] sp. LEGE 05292 TaxID=767427 RepID=UPI001881E189|nr:GAF domain-containing protein [Phormidium sp. LEGE 05292]MBE9224808.1 GAF domain-containing protein [Phormidium sp. LEGE 05292]
MPFTNNAQSSQPSLAQTALLHRMTNRIRQSLDLQEILTATVAEIRAFLDTDRVMIYRFHADSSGEVIAESIEENRLPSLLGLNFPADDIPLTAREMFVRARQRSVVNVATGEIGLSPLDCPDTGQALELEDIRYRPVDPCHIEYLKAMGIKSSVVVPILQYDISSHQSKVKLWGLLVSHHADPKTISQVELNTVQQIADQVSIAIAQSKLLIQARQQAEREAAINKVALKLHRLNTIQLPEALAETVGIFQGNGGRLYIAVDEYYPNKIYSYGDSPNIDQNSKYLLEESPIWQQKFAPKTANSVVNSVCAIADIYQDPELSQLSAIFQPTKIRGLLVISLEYRQQFLGYLTIFRHEIDKETLWAGRFDSDQRQLYPRRSFTAWLELKKGLAPDWKPEELELATALSLEFSITVHQYQLYKKVQILNADLDRQVKERTAQLEHSLSFANLLKQITDQIRSTLDFKTILQTIVKEVRQVLNTDRVVIYQFTKQWHGEVIVESTIGNWFSILSLSGPEGCFNEEIAQAYKQGRVGIINDIFRDNIPSCYSDFLQSINVRANLIVPIRMGDLLWGLLIVHQCHSPRVWLSTEIDLLQQLADQAAIAIQQAQLYQQTYSSAELEQAKAQQLEQVLVDLQKTQAQLIQTEKMSSLGQLVAGVAHEINNPVNFIFGNLTYASDYCHDLLELLQLYLKHYPQPHPEIQEKTEEIDVEFLANDLPKLLNSMKVGADRIRQLVLSLRNFSRLDESDIKPVDIHEGIDSTLMILQHRLKPKAGYSGIQIIKNYDRLPLVECYAGQLNQVFMNLLSNAIDALEAKNRIEEHTEQINSENYDELKIEISTKTLKNNLVKIKIADNALGIPPNVKSRIFDPFFTTKEPGKGTGLGLAISYQIIVQKHGGKLKCSSHPGVGTEFYIEIPVKQALKK